MKNVTSTLPASLNHKAAAAKRLKTKAIKLPKTLEALALEVGQAITASQSLENQMQSLSSKLGELVAKAGSSRAMNLERVEPFTTLCRDICVAGGMKPESLKVYLSNVRGVLRAMVAGYKPKAGETLRNMYMQRPRASTAKSGAQTVKTEKHESSIADKGVKAAPSRKELITALFGHYDEQLDAAVQWASENESAFIRYVTASIEAAKRTAEEINTKVGKATTSKAKVRKAA